MDCSLKHGSGFLRQGRLSVDEEIQMESLQTLKGSVNELGSCHAIEPFTEINP